MVREVAIKARGSALESSLVQLLLFLVAAVCFPLLLRFQTIAPEDLNNAVLQNSMIGSAFATMFGLFLFRRVTIFPGTRRFRMILPSFITSFGIVVTALLALRLDYGRFYLAASFVMAILAGYFLSFWLWRFGKRSFHIVPAGHTELMVENPTVDWIVMTEARVPADPNAVIVADLRYDHLPEWERMLAEAAVRGHPVYHTKHLRESLTGKVSIDHLSENSFGWLLPNLAYRRVKRLVDIVGCIILAPFLLLPMLGIALAIRLDSTGPVLFRQQRMGYRGKVFHMLKFRTMRERPACECEETARQDAMTADDDDRITSVGRFLRRTRLDELPQIVNVLRGEMSWIGPRPEAVTLSMWYEAELPFYLYRHIVRPGITGWAQVNHGHVTSLEEVHDKLRYDFYYIKNFSAWLDVLIALRTVPTMMSGYGSR